MTDIEIIKRLDRIIELLEAMRAEEEPADHTIIHERGMPSRFKIGQKPTEALSPDYKRQLIDTPSSMTVNSEFKGQHVTVIKHGKNTP